MSALLTLRNLMWALALGVTLVLVWYDPESGNVIKAKKIPADQSHAEAMTDNAIAQHTGEYALMPRSKSIERYASIFSVTERAVAQVARPAPVSPEQAQAYVPPLPFQYLGSVTEDGLQKWFISRDDAILTVKAGERIDSEYRLISVKKKNNRSTLTFRYLPMRITQKMVVNHAN